jgi:Fe2+ or Zn2+ uptake regulation protein
METGRVIAALNSDFRREVLRILSKEPMTVVQVLEELKRRKLGVKYRETVYRALEKLFGAGLVDKSYVKNKGLCYKLIVSCITIDISTDSLEKSH